jgi:hypothetical protein
MKLTKILLSIVSAATLGFTISACSTTANNSTANNANKPNTAVVVNSNKTAANNAVAVSNTTNANKTSTAPTPAGKSDAQEITGELQQGKTESLILYVGMESGDYAAYCFPNDSEAGRAILAACKDKEQCEVKGEIAPGKCTVPGLEADLSDSGTIVKVESVKKLAAKK